MAEEYLRNRLRQSAPAEITMPLVSRGHIDHPAVIGEFPALTTTGRGRFSLFEDFIVHWRLTAAAMPLVLFGLATSVAAQTADELVARNLAARGGPDPKRGAAPARRAEAGVPRPLRIGASSGRGAAPTSSTAPPSRQRTRPAG